MPAKKSRSNGLRQVEKNGRQVASVFNVASGSLDQVLVVVGSVWPAIARRELIAQPSFARRACVLVADKYHQKRIVFFVRRASPSVARYPVSITEGAKRRALAFSVPVNPRVERACVDTIRNVIGTTVFKPSWRS